MALQVLEEQDEADVDFWNQDFFAEERADDEYATESESEDEADTDFSGSVRLTSWSKISLAGHMSDSYSAVLPL